MMTIILYGNKVNQKWMEFKERFKANIKHKEVQIILDNIQFSSYSLKEELMENELIGEHQDKKTLKTWSFEIDYIGEAIVLNIIELVADNSIIKEVCFYGERIEDSTFTCINTEQVFNIESNEAEELEEILIHQFEIREVSDWLN